MRLTDCVRPPQVSTLRGIALGCVLLLPVIGALLVAVGPSLEIALDPVLESFVGDGSVAPAPWSVRVEAPTWDGQQACWWIAFYKLRDARPIGLSFTVDTQSYGAVPVQASLLNRETGAQRLGLDDHHAGQKWINPYCTDVAADLLPPTQRLVIHGYMAYATRHALWGSVVQPIGPVNIPLAK